MLSVPALNQCSDLTLRMRCLAAVGRYTLSLHERGEWAYPSACNNDRHRYHTSYASQHSRMRSIRKILSASLRWQWATTYATPLTSSINRRVIFVVRVLLSAFVYDCYAASFSDRGRECLKAWRWLNGETWGIGKAEWL